VRRFRSSISVAAIAIGFTALGAPPSQATPAWLAPQDVFSSPVTAIQNDPFFNRKALDVASDSAGDSIAAWVEQHPKVPGPGTECQAMWALRPAGGSFGPPQALAPPMAFCTGQIKLAMNGPGTAIAAWKQGAEIEAAIRDPGGSFGAATVLSASASTDDPWVSLNDAGVAAVSWDDTAASACPGPPSWALHVSVRQPGGGFGPFETVCDGTHPSGPTIFTPRVAVDPLGDVVATWVNFYFDGTNSHVAVESAYRQAGGTFTGATPQTLRDMLNPTAMAGTFAADVAFDALGRATAVWPYFNGSKTVIETAVRPPGASSSFSTPGPVSDPVSTGDASSPRVAVDPASNSAVAVWVQCPSSCQVEGAGRASGAGFETPQTLSAPGATTTFGPLVTFDPSGTALAVWSGPSPDVAGTQVQVTRRPPGAGQSFGAVATISREDPSQSPAIALDGAGDAIAIWDHDTTSPAGAVIQYAGFDAAAPEIRAVTAPNGVASLPLGFAAEVFDNWSSPSVGWSFGDGTAATGATATHAYARPGTYAVTVTAQDAVGNTSALSRNVTIVSSLPRPSLTRFTQSHSRWREGRKLATLARTRKRGSPVGTTFSFALNTAASVKLRFTQSLGGRRVAGRCVAQTKHNRRGRACKRTVTAGVIPFANAHAGTNRIVFQGNISRTKRLQPGRYTVELSAANASGIATGKRLSFTIVRE